MDCLINVASSYGEDILFKLQFNYTKLTVIQNYIIFYMQNLNVQITF